MSESTMAPLISCQDISKSFGSRDLFHGLSVSLFSGDRVGLIGPNGAGKSTFLKLLGNLDIPDSGEIVSSRGLRVAYVAQHVEEFSGKVEEAVEEVLNDVPELDAYAKHAEVRKILGALGFTDPSKRVEELSGGWKRRLSIARALVKKPDVLLLDEPTNHLDLDGILWLENFLQREKITFIVISHDRVFLDNICNRMWEISHRYPGGVFAADGAYAEFMERRATFLEGQVSYEKGLRSKMRREEEWLRQTPKARTTKSRSRIQEAARLQHELAQVKLRNIEKKSQLALADTGRQTKKLVAAKNIGKTLGDNQLFSGLDLTLCRGDRLGIAGENGSGKSTLLRVLAEELPSDTGTIKYADGLEMFLFDQHREKLDLAQPLRRGLAPEGDTIRFRGKNIHVNAWCERFLFRKNQLDLPMKMLSGGERARVVIARLMSRPSDVLLLDEPTNDLDIDTLEILEESLDDFPGAVVLVTHDRAMMDRVADRLILPSGETFDDTASWLQWRKEQRSQKKTAKPKEVREKPRGLSYQEKRELEGMEDKVLALESQIEELAKQTEDPAVSGDSAELQRVCDQMGKAQHALDETYLRWQELEKMQHSTRN